MLMSEILLLGSLALAAALWFTRLRTLRALALAALLLAVASAVVILRQGGWQAWAGLGAAVLLALAFVPWRARWPRILGRMLGVAGVLALLACAVGIHLFPAFSLPAPGGPHAIGTRHFDMVDPARTGLLEDAPGTPRRIVVWTWYPAVDHDAPRRPYFTGDERELALSVARNWGLPRFALDRLRAVGTHATTDAALSQARREWPVVVFNHGYWGWPGQNTALMERLASRGYLVFSIGHPHDAGTLRFADGARIGTSPNKAAASVPTEAMLAFWKASTHEAHYRALAGYQHDFDRHRVMRSFDAWRGDVRFLVDALAGDRLPAAADGLARAADLSRLAFVGMSFGGTVSASACHHDARCTAAANLDGEEFDWSLWDADVRMPLLMVHSDFEQYPLYGPGTGASGMTIMDYSYERWAEAGRRPDVVRARVLGERHLGLTDLPLSARNPVRERYYGGQSGEASVAAVNDLVTAFLDQRLKGEASGFPAAQFRAHPGALRRHDIAGVREWWRQRERAPAPVR